MFHDRLFAARKAADSGSIGHAFYQLEQAQLSVESARSVGAKVWRGMEESLSAAHAYVMEHAAAHGHGNRCQVCGGSGETGSCYCHGCGGSGRVLL